MNCIWLLGRLSKTFVAALVATVWMISQVSGAELVARAKIDALVKPLIDDGWLNGVAIGIVDANGCTVFGYGATSDTNARPPDGETIFEIGSVTKVFTSLLLAEMVERGTVRLDTPVGACLPAEVTVPKFGDREITLVDLATHTSALPRLPTNLNLGKIENPYAEYTADDLYEFLKQYKLVRSPGEKSEYSNVGVGLLGHALALKANKDYEDLVVDDICRPLAMGSTRITLDADQLARLAQGHNGDGVAVKNWDLQAIAPAGALRSTVKDLAKFVSANLGLVDTPLAAAMKLAQTPHFGGDGSAVIGLGWQIDRRHGTIWHNGETGGYHALVVLAPKQKVGVVVLANTASSRVVDPLGNAIMALALGENPKPLSLPKAIKLNAAKLDGLVGDFALLPGMVLMIRREGDVLSGQLLGQPPFRLWPETDDNFNLRLVPASVEFTRDANGQATDLTLHQFGKKFAGKRIEAEQKKD